MGTYFDIDYPGDAFVLFGAAHLGTLVAMALAVAWFVHTGRRAATDTRQQMRRLLAIILLLNEIGWHVYNVAHGAWVVQRMIPLHMCSVMVWLSIAVLWIEGRGLYAALYFLGVGGAIQALVTPDAGIYGFPHFRFFQTMIAHGGLVAAGLWIVLVERYVPTPRDLVRILVALNVYALGIYFVNLALGSNYLYVNGKPDIASLLDFMPAWPWYLPILEILAIVLFGLMLLPFRRRWRVVAAA